MYFLKESHIVIIKRNATLFFHLFIVAVKVDDKLKIWIWKESAFVNLTVDCTWVFFFCFISS